jgi:hypothetical protein
LQIHCHRQRETDKEHSHSDVALQIERNEYELPIPFVDSTPDSTNQSPCEKPELICISAAANPSTLTNITTGEQ